MEYKYLESYHLTNLHNYCRTKCIHIVINHHNESNDKIEYYRGLYAGYLYGKKVSNFIKKRIIRLTNRDLYYIFKYQRILNNGTKNSFYDIMNFIVETIK